MFSVSIIARVLVCAAVYNVVWGTWVVLFPNHAFHLLGVPPPNYPALWQCIGMIVGVYGIGYAIAAIDPIRHWPIVFVGLLGKVFGPLGFLLHLYQETLPLSFGWLIVFNDVVWWIPFLWLLSKVYRDYLEERGASSDALSDAIESVVVRTQQNSESETLGALSMRSPVLILFLRHAGCTFCRETLHELAKRQSVISARNLIPVVVHMGESDDEFQVLLKRFGISDSGVVADPSRRLFRAFDLRRGSLLQVFGPKVWLRGLQGILKGYGIGPLKGDGFQLAGSFILFRREIVWAQRSRSADERVRFEEGMCSLT